MLHISDLHFRFDDVAVLQGVNLHLDGGWTGVVGPNGAGKTTLLRLIDGTLAPTAGRLDVPAPVHRCDQQVLRTDQVDAFAQDWSRPACRWRGRLDLDPDTLDRWPTLSPGERKRWQLGAALAAEPAVLLLDEPTNHLDAAGRAMVVEALRRFRGLGLVVSHDRDLLDTLTAATLWVEDGALRAWPVSYSQARVQRGLEHQAARDARDAAGAQVRRAAQELQRSRQRLAAAERGASTRRRMKGPRDHDARSSLAKQRAADGVAAQGKGVGNARAALQRATGRASALQVSKERGAALFIDHVPPRRSVLLELAAPVVCAGDTAVLRDVSLQLRRGAHVHLAGPNGSGKSTLIRALLADHGLPPERLLVLPQDLGPPDVDALLRAHRGLADPKRVDHVLAALGVSPQVLRRTPSPSAGEARKLALALGMGRDAWALILDEPTNHLDLPSVERLQVLLQAFPGAVLLTTHDAALAAATCGERWELENHRVRVATVR